MGYFGALSLLPHEEKMALDKQLCWCISLQSTPVANLLQTCCSETAWLLLACWSWVLLSSLSGEKILKGSHHLRSAIIRQQNFLSVPLNMINTSPRTELLSRPKSGAAFTKSLITAFLKQDDCSNERQETKGFS